MYLVSPPTKEPLTDGLVANVYKYQELRISHPRLF